MIELAPDDPQSCPWCLAPPSSFRRRESGLLGCGRCAAVLPEEELWYLTGDKIVTIRDAANRAQYDCDYN